MATALRVSLCFFCDVHLWCQVSRTLLQYFQRYCFFSILQFFSCKTTWRHHWPNLHNRKTSISLKRKKDISKRKTPFFCILKGLSNKQKIFFMSWRLRQTANGKTETRLPSLFSRVYSKGRLFVFAMNSRRRYSIFVCFIYGLEGKNSKSEVIFAVCRLPFTSSLTSLKWNSMDYNRTLKQAKMRAKRWSSLVPILS